MKHHRLVPLSLCLALSLLGQPLLSADQTDAVYDLGHVLDVRIEMTDDDWNLMRRQHPDVYALDKPNENEDYTYVKSTLTIDGAKIGTVGVRKKGFVGSSSSNRPSIKINIRAHDKLKFSGMSRLTLNNNQQDPSNMHQVLVYHLFRKAGIPTPRCSFATVTINGDAKGLYTNVEPIKKPFLKQHFKDAKGNLYEGRRSDFRKDWTVTFEKKTNSDSGQADLERLVAALELDDAELLQAVGKVVDIDAFLRYWAMECLVGHWDGYAENLNNFYIYNDPTSGEFHFIPWGADSAFGDPNDFLEYKPPASVRAEGILARRLYNHPETRQRYRDTLANLLENVWDEDELLELVDQLEAIVQEKSPAIRGHNQAVAKIRKFIESRRVELTTDLVGPGTSWDFPLPDEIMLGAGEPKGTFTAKFTAKWAGGSMVNPFANSHAEFDLVWDEEVPQFVVKGASAAPFPESFRFGYPHLMIGGVTTKGHLFGASLIVDHDSFKPGDHSLDLFEVMGVMIDFNVLGGKPKPDLLGFLSGTLHLDKTSLKKGEEVSGTLKAEIR